jgi:predicted AAA+ superfamily ATPase
LVTLLSQLQTSLFTQSDHFAELCKKVLTILQWSLKWSCMNRMQTAAIIKDLSSKMVLISGPRQVGKTWLAKEIGKQFSPTVYLNYDNLADRQIIKEITWPEKTKLVILDEIHKMPNWKSYLKGVFDQKPQGLRIIVTGSARLETFKDSGDSLAGRFFLHRLLPFSLEEVKETFLANNLDHFLERGGFPEPLLAKNAIEAKRWRAQYVQGLIREDILNFEQVNDFQAIKLVFELLRSKVGSPISYASIAQDVEIAPNTVKKYLQIMEALFLVFRVSPFSKNIARSLKKEAKIYFFDTGLVRGNEGLILENEIAVQLLKKCYLRSDLEGDDWELQYLRTKEGREVDFALVKNQTITKLIEVKKRQSQISANLQYFTKKYNLKGLQLVKELRQESQKGNIQVVRADRYLAQGEF